MDEDEFQKQLREAELALAEAEKTYGPEHSEVADKLLRYASVLRQTPKRTLDAVNVEARAKAIRAKMFAAEATKQNIANVPLIRPVQQSFNLGVYLGLAGMMLAFGSMFINCQYFIVLAAFSVCLLLGDLVVSRTWWRALLGTVFLVSSWGALQALPPIMLVNASPIERFNYSSENSEVVAKVRKLGKPTQALVYRLCLPQGFTFSANESKEWGRVISWKGVARSDADPAMLYLMSIDPPAEIKKQFRSYSLLKGSHDIVFPHVYEVLQLDAVKQGPPQFEHINGLQFVRLEFTNSESLHPRRGFVYVTKEHNRLIAIAGVDAKQFAAATIEPMEASVWTLIRNGRTGDLDI